MVAAARSELVEASSAALEVAESEVVVVAESEAFHVVVLQAASYSHTVGVSCHNLEEVVVVCKLAVVAEVQ